MATLKLILNVFKKKVVFGQELIPHSLASRLPSLGCCDFIWEREVGLCRSELSEHMNTNGNTSHISIAPPVQTWILWVAEPYLSSAIVLSCICYSLRLWTFVTALGNCRNSHCVAFHPVVSCAANSLLPFPPSNLSSRWLRWLSSSWQLWCGSREVNVQICFLALCLCSEVLSSTPLGFIS